MQVVERLYKARDNTRFPLLYIQQRLCVTQQIQCVRQNIQEPFTSLSYLSALHWICPAVLPTFALTISHFSALTLATLHLCI